MTVAVGQRGSTIPDGVLVQEAAAGSGESYGALYDRYAPEVFNYCLRISGSPDDAADATHEAFLNVLRRLQDDDRPVLDFAPYLFASARNESYALMRRGNRVYPSESLPEDPGGTTEVDADPERFALLRDSQDEVRAANAQLAPRHREVLALRELGERSYDEIGQIMGISENGAAQLIWRARMKMREALTAGAVASVVAMSPDCERAQVLLTRMQDGEPVDDPDRYWLDEHLDDCGSCRAARGMLLEVGATYGCWLPAAALIGMREETLTAAGSMVGADWSAVASAPPGGGSAAAASTSAGPGAGAAVAGVATLAALGIALSVIVHDDSQMKRKLADSVRQPAAEAQAAKAPKAKRAAPAAPAARPSASRAAPGAAGDAVTALRRPASDARPVGGEPRSTQGEQPPGPGDPKRTSPRDESPGPGTPGPGSPTPEPNKSPTPEPNNGPPVDTPPSPGPPQPGPAKPTPTVGTTPPPGPPPPPEQGECTWPGGGGPGGCPPGHGGIPPGHGGTPPGQVGKPGGRGPR